MRKNIRVTMILLYMALLLLLYGCSSGVSGDILKKGIIADVDYIVVGDKEKGTIDLINGDEKTTEIKVNNYLDKLIIIDDIQLQIILAISRKNVTLYDIQEGRMLNTIDINGNKSIFDITYFYDQYGLNIGIILGDDGREFGDSINIFRYEEGIIKKVYERDLSEFNPWTIKAGDVDGDGEPDISIGVFKEARFHKVMAKRPFFFNWDGEKIYAKWLGSRLSKPFEDYYLIDINGDSIDELIAIEYLRDRSQTLSLYSWNGFGFTMINDMEYDGTIIDIMASNLDRDNASELAILSKEEQKSYITLVDYSNGKLEIIQKEEGDFKRNEYALVFNDDGLKLFYLSGRKLKVKTIGGVLNE